MEKHPKEREVRRIFLLFAAWSTGHTLHVCSQASWEQIHCRIAEEENCVYKHRFTGNQAAEPS